MSNFKVKSRSLNEDVKDAIYRYIDQMNTEDIDKLPREEALAEILGVSRVTIRRALSDLSKEGIIIRKHGRGTFINKEVLQIKVTFNPAQEFENMIRNSGYKAEVVLHSIEVKEAGETIASKLQINPDDEIVVVKKIFYADGNPAIFCVDNIPKKLVPDDAGEDDFKENVFDFLEKYASRKVVRDIVEISTVLSTDIDELERFMSLGSLRSYLCFEATNFDQDNAPVLYDLEYYDTDYIKFNSFRMKKV